MNKKLEKLIKEFKEANRARRRLYAKRYSGVWAARDEEALTAARLLRIEKSRLLVKELKRHGLCLVWNASGSFRGIVSLADRRRRRRMVADEKWLLRYRVRSIKLDDNIRLLTKLDLT